MKNKNAGLTLVEFIVVVSILAIVTGIGIMGIGQVSGYRARECSNAISTSLSTCKVDTLGKAKATKDIYWELYQENNKYYAKTVYNAVSGTSYEKVEKVGDSGLTVKWTNGGTPMTIEGATKLKLYYNRSSGALLEEGQTESTMANLVTLSVSNGSKTYTIDIYPVTGKVKGTY